MFNFEMISSDGVFQICDDIVSEKLTNSEIKECIITFYHNLKDANSRTFENDISFNFCKNWNYTDEQKENIIFNLNAIYDCIYKMQKEIFDVFYNYEDDICPSYWYTLSCTAVALIRYKKAF